MTIQSVNHSIEQLKAYEMDKSNEELTREYGLGDIVKWRAMKTQRAARHT